MKDETPVGCKIILSREYGTGDRYWRSGENRFKEVLLQYSDELLDPAPFLVPDNCYGKFLENVSVPAGYRLVGSIRDSYKAPRTSQHYISKHGCAEQAGNNFPGECRYLVIEKIPEKKKIFTIEVDGSCTVLERSTVYLHGFPGIVTKVEEK